MDYTKIFLFILGLTTGIYAVFGFLQGEIYCKGGRYSRESEPVRFWSAILVYLAWTFMMGYFLFLKNK